MAGRVEAGQVVFDLDLLLRRGFAISREGKPFRLIAFVPEVPLGQQSVVMFDEYDKTVQIFNTDGTWSIGLGPYDLFTAKGIQ